MINGKENSFALMEAMQLEREKVDIVIENLDKIIETVITEIKQSHEEVGISVSSVPDVQALLDIVQYVR